MAAKPLSFDISGENVWVKGNGLVTIEHIKNMGKGQLTFCAAFLVKRIIVRLVREYGKRRLLVLVFL